MTNQLSTLHHLASLKHDVALSDLAQHDRVISKLECEIAALNTRLRDPIDPMNGDLPLSATSGYFDKWQRWAETKIAEQNSILARARAEREDLLVEARLSFGRKSATEALLDKAEDERRQKAHKRREQDQAHS